MRTVKALAIVLVVLVLASIAWRWRAAPPTLYVGGPILTMDAENSVVEALLTEGDRIAAVGSAAELRPLAGSARVVDLAGQALLPGFIDAHSHFPGDGLRIYAADLNSPPIGDTRTIQDIRDRLGQLLEEKEAGDWILGMGYDDSLLTERRHPNRYDLDEVSLQHPIAILHVSGHMGVVSSKALDVLGLSRTSPDPPGGRLGRDANGDLDGLLEETAMEAAMKAHLMPALLPSIEIVREGGRIYAAAGITTAQVGYATEDQIWGLEILSRLGLIPMRLILWPSSEAADKLIDGSLSFASYDPTWVRLGAVKLMADGSIQGYTGYLSQPYHVPPGDDPTYRGYPRMTAEQLAKAVLRYHRKGFQVAVHGNGDAAIDDILDALEAAQSEPTRDWRPIVIHAQMAREDQLRRMKSLHAIPSFFSLHTYYWGDRHRNVFMGPERADRMSPAKTAADLGLRFTIHTDAPIVPMEPLRLVWSAVNRLSTSNVRIGRAERIRPMQALRAITIDAAYQHFLETDRGSLEAGKLADLVILSESPLQRARHLDRIRVVETIVAGRTIYRQP